MSKLIHQDEDSDSDDWFNKDENDFVVKVGTQQNNDGTIEAYDEQTGVNRPGMSVREMINNLKLPLNDFDGNYVESFNNADIARTSKFNIPKSAPGKYIQPIPLTKLMNIAENETVSMFADINAEKDEFVATLMKRTYGEALQLVIMKVMIKLGTIPMYETVKQFFKILFAQTQFWDQLQKFFQQSTEQRKRKKTKNKIIRPTVSKEEMIDIMLKFLTEAKRHVSFEKHVIDFCENLKEMSSDSARNQNEVFSELITFVTKKRSCKKVSIYPTIRELRAEISSSLDLQKNIVKGKYQSVEHYLEVHLNLLKEDFLIPMRTGIEMYRKFVEKHGARKSFIGDELRVHYPVKLFLPSLVNRHTAKDQLVLVDLDPTERGYMNFSARYRRLALPSTKRLMSGSMVLFSSGPELTDLIVATISNRDAAQLLDGYIYVEFICLEQETETEGKLNSGYTNMVIFDRPLLMIESGIFFEPYHQTFNALKRLREDDFPLKSYIVDVTLPGTCLPEYLCRRNGHLFSYGGIEFDLKKVTSWPSTALAAAVGLKSSQFEAFRMALTSQFALIQGPPGTGKTFLGLRILETLLANTSEQILLICLTNHALDQFLCGVTRFTNSIVRMGGQSKHPLLDAYNVKQLQEDEGIDKRLRISYYNAKQEYLKLVDRFDQLQQSQQEQDESKAMSKAIIQCMEEMLHASHRLNELSQLSTLKLVQNIRVVAMTTTYAARNRTLLELLRTPIVVIEEAAEVLEAHIVSSLTRHTQQCILIGDHKQLRPTTSTYVLSNRYRMDLSLFERMINNNFNVATLTVQHRMRPEIANLLRPTIYPVLEDTDTVRVYPSVVGMKQNLFFLTHRQPEGGSAGEPSDKQTDDESNDAKSKKNMFECRFLLALCEYLLTGGVYTAKDIVILTAYNGQMQQMVLEKKRRSALQGIRVAVIDNYQGEESKIILLSLVRSTSSDVDNIGFLAHKNRICVALSRAREGLYIVGNMRLLAKCSKTWAAIDRKLREQNSIGDSLPLQCVKHGQVMEVSHPEELEAFSISDRQCICVAP
ncbi:NFX1-type zinc finger-containing protein 1 [Anopheles nili]|uniref:NFX1-type zinc finger-containing protein 1 n=1 Tax=Anopheles nili TaxID=185578 RepID=UPI00237ACB2E|nr:NFX1-type zinc finger-containing protein 1 [Anopheles nili]